MPDGATSSAVPFFIVGAPRSGTTLVQQLLTRHPDVAVSPETHFVRRFVDSGAGRGLDDDLRWMTLLRQVEDLPEFGESDLDRDLFRRMCHEGPQELRTVMAAWLSAFGTARGVVHVGEKTPHHMVAIDVLREWFPGCRFVAVVRDPRAVAASTGRVWWSAGSARGDARAWRRYEAALERALASPTSAADVVVVRYEDLVVRPQEQAERIFDAIGVEAVDIDAASPRTTVAIDVVREQWKENAATAVDPSMADAWRSTMSAADVAAVEQVAWHGMRRHGYRRTSRARDLVLGVLGEDLLSVARRGQVAALRLRPRRGGGSP